MLYLILVHFIILMATPISQKDYLKRYLSGKNSENKKKKKRKEKKDNGKGMRIVEDSITLAAVPFGYAVEEEENPTIAEVTYDDLKLKALEEFKANKKWKRMAEDKKINYNMFKNLSVNCDTLSSPVRCDSNIISETLKESHASSNEHKNLHQIPPEKNNKDHSLCSTWRSKLDLDPLSSSKGSRNDPIVSQLINEKHNSITFPGKINNVLYSPLTSIKIHDSNVSLPKIKNVINDYSSKGELDFDSCPPRRKRHDSEASLESGEKPLYKNISTTQNWDSLFDANIKPSLSTNKKKYSDLSLIKNSHNSDVISMRRRNCYLDSLPKSSNQDLNLSPLHKRCDSDASPPHDSEASPPRRSRHDSDASPPRRSRHDSDVSPPRRRHCDSNVSPPRRRHYDSDVSPPRRRHCDSNVLPPRRRHCDSDVSPLRKINHDLLTSPLRINRNDSDSFSQCTEKLGSTLSSTINSQPSRSTVRMTTQEYLIARKRGQLKKDTPEDLARKKRELVLQRAAEEKHQSWNRGVKQLQEREERLKEDLHESKKCFARGVDDLEMNAHLKDIARAEDPMIDYMMKKKAKVNNRPMKPTYQGSFPPNRLNIHPGYRWDGVDRSNGFEQEWFQRQNAMKAQNDEAYKWSIENM